VYVCPAGHGVFWFDKVFLSTRPKLVVVVSGITTKEFIASPIVESGFVIGPSLESTFMLYSMQASLRTFTQHTTIVVQQWMGSVVNG